MSGRAARRRRLRPGDLGQNPSAHIWRGWQPGPHGARFGAGRGLAATTLQSPEFGVAIDADGVVTQLIVEDPGGRLAAERIAAARAALPADVVRPALLRTISLVGLDAAIRRRAAAGDEPDPVERHLAGLMQVQYAFLYPARRDIVA